MTSREAIAKINVLSSYETSKEKHEEYKECINAILKDLEILELIKERLYHTIMDNIVFVDNLKLTERIDENGKITYIDEDKYKIMRWLDNDK